LSALRIDIMCTAERNVIFVVVFCFSGLERCSTHGLRVLFFHVWFLLEFCIFGDNPFYIVGVQRQICYLLSGLARYGLGVLLDW